MVNRNIGFCLKDLIRDEEGRMLLLRAEIRGQKILICNIYAHNDGKTEFFVRIFKEIEQTGVDRKIIVGDFNTVLDEEKDRSIQVKHANFKAAQVVNIATEHFSFIDVWREKFPNKPGYTWRRRKPVLSERLDYVLVTDTMWPFINEVNILPGY